MSHQPYTIAIIPARGGSKGVPRKNIRQIGNKPLIAYAIECGLSSNLINDVIISTDDKEIAAIAKHYGAHVPFMRPSVLASDMTPMLDVLQHAVKTYEELHSKKIDVMVLLDPTAPLRKITDIDEAFKIFFDSKCDAVVSGNTAHRNPYFNMVLEKSGFVSLVNDSPQPVTRRQDAPLVYDLNTVVWIYSRKAIMEEKARIPQKTCLYLVPPKRAIDLDTEFDFELLEWQMKM